jgi:hypothetical protein
VNLVPWKLHLELLVKAAVMMRTMLSLSFQPEFRVTCSRALGC